jgi:hypothetical protein
MIKLFTISLICANTIFINHSHEAWTTRDLKEFATIKAGDRCLINQGLPCIHKFIKEPFEPNGVHYYTVICGAPINE